MEVKESCKSKVYLGKSKKFPGVCVWGQGKLGEGRQEDERQMSRWKVLCTVSGSLKKALGRQKKSHTREETMDLVFRKITPAPRWQIDFMSNASSN